MVFHADWHGAVATPVEVSELATALATGLVIGQENPLPNIFNLKLYEGQKYVMMTSHMQSVLSVFVNERIWQGIPAADRKIVEDTMPESPLRAEIIGFIQTAENGVIRGMI